MLQLYSTYFHRGTFLFSTTETTCNALDVTDDIHKSAGRLAVKVKRRRGHMRHGKQLWLARTRARADSA